MSTEQANSRIPALDGWRGIAILLVLFDHTMNVFWGDGTSPWVQTGQHGVTLFFVLSGFLITSTLLNRPADLKGFYIRRIFRLMPVSCAYLAFLCVLDQRVHVVSGSALISSLFFFRNFDATPFGSTTWHFWSLSLEEQFYLAWPMVLLLVGARWSRWIAIVAMGACATYRLIFWNQFNQQFFNCQTQVRADALLAGCLLALLLREPEFRARIEKLSAVLALPALCALIYCIGKFTLLPPLVESVSIAALLAASVLHPKSTFVKPLNWRLLSRIGVVSYSVYVWQELFMLIAGDQQILPRILTLSFAFPLLAICSYLYLERPLARVGQRLSDRLNGRRTVPQLRPVLENESAA